MPEVWRAVVMMVVGTLVGVPSDYSDDRDEFVRVADAVAAEAEALADRITDRFAGLNGMQQRARGQAELSLRNAAHMLSRFADVEWSDEQEADWQRQIEESYHEADDSDL